MPTGEQYNMINYKNTDVICGGSGGGRQIVRVDVSEDGGRSWKQAEIGEGGNQVITTFLE